MTSFPYATPVERSWHWGPEGPREKGSDGDTGTKVGPRLIASPNLLVYTVVRRDGSLIISPRALGLTLVRKLTNRRPNPGRAMS